MEYALRLLSPNNPTSIQEVILGDIPPPNVVPFPEYVRKRNLELALHLSPKLNRSQWEKQHISRLYRILVLPYFPKDKTITLDHVRLFLHFTLPYIIRNTTFEGQSALCNSFYHRNRAFLLKAGIQYPTFKKRCMAVIANAYAPPAPAHSQVKKPLHREALRIISALAGYGKGHFYLTGRDLQARLFVRHKKTAQRILERFCAIGVLQVVERGIDRREAKEMGVKAKATTYRLLIEGSRS